MRLCLIITVLFRVFIFGYCEKKNFASMSDRRAPAFAQEPPFRVEFLNTSGVVISCSARGRPQPTVRWLMEDGSSAVNLPELRHVRPDGSLVFHPFPVNSYRQDVHAANYRCLAANSMGSLLSRKVHVRATMPQSFSIEMHDEFVLKGNTAVLRCHVPGLVKEDVYVEAWIKNPSEKVDAYAKHSRYSMFPTGELHVRNVQQSDALSSYTCHTKHRLTGRVIASVNSGRIIVTEPYGQVPSRITHVAPKIVASSGDRIQLPCAAQAFPLPSYRWYREEGSGNGGIVPVRLGPTREIVAGGGTLILTSAEPSDSGRYICVAVSGNTEDKGLTDLLITAPLSATVVPDEQIADIGSRIAFNCNVSGHPISQVEWTKDGTMIRSLSDSGRIKQLSSHQLIVQPVRREDRGIYQCFVSNDFDSAQGASQLLIGDNPPEFLLTFKNVTVESGSSVSLKCIASGNPLPQITWTLDGTPVPEDQSFRSGDYVTQENTVVSYVNVSRVGIEHSGEFTCRATNDAGQIYHSGWLIVPGPPFVRTMANRTVVAGETLRIRCPAGGYPLQEISWERDGVRLPDNHRQTVYPNGTLLIRLVERPTDEGRYTCSARNKEGDSATGSFHVTVRVRPVIEPFSMPSAVQMGQRLSISCTVVQGDPPMKLKWLKDGRSLKSTDTLRVHNLADYSSTLLFEAVRPEQRGNYTCVATNEAGSTSHSAAMVIHVPPRWKSEPMDIEVIRGKSVIIDCTAEGFPPPRLSWRRAEGDVTESYKPISSSSHLHVFENGSLTILDATENDAGFYLCQASNGIGSGLSKVVRLSIHVAAHFTIKFHAEITKKGEDAKLSCQAYGERPLAINWTKDRQALNTKRNDRYKLLETVFNNGTLSELIIESVERGDSALFNCHATNGYGKDETNIQLIIQEKPDTPQDLKVTRSTSRTVQLSWSPPYSGNSRLLKYLLHYEAAKIEQTDLVSENTVSNRRRGAGSSERRISIPPSEVSWAVSGLVPKTAYTFRISAVNGLGESDPSASIIVQTEEEAPGGPPLSVKALPLSSTAIKVTWKPPEENLRFGSIKGYYIGYKIKDTNDQYLYKTLEVDKTFQEGGESLLSNLRRNMDYNIRVQAFNDKGAGPPSEDVISHTLKEDPPLPPVLEIEGITSSSITAKWKKHSADLNPITGFTLHYKRKYGAWKDSELSGEHSSHTLTNLQCGTRYDLYVTPHNAIGSGEASEITTTRTLGHEPVAPTKETLLSLNSTSIVIRLGTWDSSGCPITHFEVQYKQQRHKQWILFADRVSPNRKNITLSNLAASTWYQLRVTANNDAGPTEAEYVFSTMPEARGTLQDSVLVTGDSVPFYLEIEVILPVSLSLVVVVAVFVLVCLIVRKRNPTADSSHNAAPSTTYVATSHKSHAESVHMCDMEKSSSAAYQRPLSRPDPSIYYPTPYATTHIASEDGESAARRKAYEAAERELQDEHQYATVKRTPRPPKSDVHIYHYPAAVHIPPELLDELQGTSSSCRWADPGGGGSRNRYESRRDSGGEDYLGF